MLAKQIKRVAVLAASCCLLAVSCSDESEPSESELVDHQAATALLATAGVQLDPTASACVADGLDGELLAEGALLDADQASDVANRAVDCLGSPAIARASVAAVTGGASEASIECAAEAFDRDLVANLLSSALLASAQQGGTATSAEVEIELSRALSVCLTLAELGSIIE